jgi:stage II sporulation protein M
MKDFRRYLIIAAILFFSSILLGFFTPIEIDLASFTVLGDVADDLESFSSPGVFIYILFNNLIAIAIAFFLAPFFCLFPLFSLFINGFVIGVVGALVVEQESILFLIAGFLPHGILEIPALLIALAASLRFGFNTLRGLLRKSWRSTINPGFLENAKLLGIAAALLIPAALIETYITPIFLGLF